MRKSEEFSKRKPDYSSKSLSKNKQNKLDFGSLSTNSRRKNKNKDLKDSVSYEGINIIADFFI